MRILASLAVLQVAVATLLGIDFGTEFSKSALVAPNVPFEIVLTPDSKRKDASGLLLKSSGNEVERVYGSSGVTLSTKFPEGAFYFMKPLLGSKFGDDAVSEFNRLHPGVELTSTSRRTVGAKVGKDIYPVEEILAFSLKETRGRASDLLKQRLGQTDVRYAALTVPPQFTMSQRQALIDAATLAGFEVAALVNDGVAVAVNYASTRVFNPEEIYLAVYDMGSESTSCTILAVSEADGVKNLNVAGMGVVDGLGGKHVTSALQNLLLEKFAEKLNKSPGELQTTRILSRLWKEAERVKAVLSANTEVSVHVESLYKDEDFNVHLTRQDLEDLAKTLLSRVQEPLKAALTLYNGTVLPVESLDSVILTGGATRMPAVQQGIRDLAGDIISKNVNADEAGALGAALRGIAISGVFKSKPINVVDRTPHTYSIAINDGERQPIFPRGAALNSEQYVNFTVPDAADEAHVSLFEDDKELVTWVLPQTGIAIETLEEEDGDKCVDDIMIATKFTLTHSNVVQLSDAFVRCHGAPELVPRELGDDEQPLPNAMRGTEQDSHQPVYKRDLAARPHYVGAEPLASTDRLQIMYHMRNMDSADAERLRRQTLHNELEGLLYRARETKPEDEFVVECLEWLEEESGTVVQLSERIKKVKKVLGLQPAGGKKRAARKAPKASSKSSAEEEEATAEKAEQSSAPASGEPAVDEDKHDEL